MNTDLTAKTEADLTALAHRMNATPRKCLAFMTPAEVLKSCTTGQAAASIIDNTPVARRRELTD
jgi:IS30 family transposase